MDEVFGEENFVAQIYFKKQLAVESNHLTQVRDYIIWYAKNKDQYQIFDNYFSRRKI